uniref:Uncharacterized protein n=1 Tax=Gossypium raimondii TaxID=29730 RepID=A0A0D2VI10_GOSRA|nr:hypothetical protein B456_011G044300 [Gossypium raimondii]
MKASMKGDFPKGVVKRNKKVASAALIKCQWTDDEDRKLIRLVKQYGVRKWAQIAESLVGRAGNSVERGGIIICALISRLIEYLNPNNLLTFPLMYHKEELSHHAARAEVLQTLLFLHLVLGVEQGSGF